jgi:Ca2+-binding EF-hand superfamily protein
MRALNLNPSEIEILELKGNIDPNRYGYFDHSSLMTLIFKRGNDTETFEDLVESLKVFDTNQDGKLSVSEFRYAMSNHGEMMSEAEIEDVLGEVEVKDDLILITDLVKYMFIR